MNVLISGDPVRVEELLTQLPDGLNTDTFETDLDYNKLKLENYHLVFDLNMDEHSHKLKFLTKHTGLKVFICAVKNSLASMLFENKIEKPECELYGINSLAGFISRPLKEITMFDFGLQNEKLNDILKELNWKAGIVADRTGMVTPRVIFMIINEACFTLQEGTAGIKDIDMSMKLGTNYPSGPFEWANQCGIKNVYETLYAVFKDTKDERYKICPLLKSMYLKNKTFIIE